jgi:ParB/RepB/Spo0J family partition protein
MDPRAKLTETQILEAKHRLDTEANLTIKGLAAQLGIDKSNLSRALAKLSAVPPAPGSAEIIDLPLELLMSSPFNPRREFDEERITELAEAIAAEGLLQNLVVKQPQPNDHYSVNGADGTQTPGLYEIIAGERRFRAITLLASQNRWTGKIPCRVIDVKDSRHIALALMENLQRENLSVLEEAEAIASLHRMDPDGEFTTHNIAAGIGKKVRYVQQRLQIANNLVEPARTLLRYGHIDIETARQLAAAPVADQFEALAEQNLNEIGEHTPPDELAAHIAEEGEIDKIWIFDCLNRISMRRDTAKMDAARAAAPPPQSAMRLDTPGNHEPREPADDGADEEPDYVSSGLPGFASPKPQLDAKEPEEPSGPPVTKAHIQHAHKRKTQAMQRAVVEDPAMAMRLACLSLLTHNIAVRINSGIGGVLPDDRPYDDGILQMEINTALDGVKLPEYQGDGKDLPLWKRLMALEDAHLERLFATLVARTVITPAGHSCIVGDEPLALAIATDLSIAGNEEKHGLALTAEDLLGIRKPMLWAIGKSLISEGSTTSASKTADIITAITESPGSKNHILPTLRFNTTKKIEAAITKVMK